jgi:hypothetical protein
VCTYTPACCACPALARVLFGTIEVWWCVCGACIWLVECNRLVPAQVVRGVIAVHHACMVQQLTVELVVSLDGTTTPLLLEELARPGFLKNLHGDLRK